MPVDLTEATDVALAYQAATTTLSGRLSAVMSLLWRQVGPWDVAASWDAALGEAVGAFTAAQAIAAGMADGYVGSALAAQGTSVAAAHAVVPAAFAGEAASGLALEDLLSIPADRAQRALLAGVPRNLVMTAAEGSLRMYAATEVHDAANLSSQAAMVTHRAGGYVRIVGPLCCSRCAILSGRVYRWSRGFDRHPHDRCKMCPLADVEDVEPPSPQTLFREGRITDLTHAEREAVGLGADIGQVVNAKRGMYVAGGHAYTTTGTTRRGVAGARILARDIARTSGAAPGAVYRNFTISRAQVVAAEARYGGMLRKGMPFQRGDQTVRLSFARSGRLSVSEILRTATSRDDATRMMINMGYVL